MYQRKPLFTLIGLGLGTFISFFGLIQILFRYKKEQEALNRDKQKDRGNGQPEA